jgi:nitrile hydratase
VTAFASGAAVRVRDDWPERRGPCHVRTPHYLRGRTGRILRPLGRYPDPGALAFGRPAAALALYHVVFDQAPIWGEGSSADSLLVELYETWLEPA